MAELRRFREKFGVHDFTKIKKQKRNIINVKRKLIGRERKHEQRYVLAANDMQNRSKATARRASASAHDTESSTYGGYVR